jgi:hypothetical protein
MITVYIYIYKLANIGVCLPPRSIKHTIFVQIVTIETVPDSKLMTFYGQNKQNKLKS